MSEGPPTAGQLVAKARRRKGWSQLRLARELDRSESWVTKLETGQLGLDSARMAHKVGTLLRLDPATLLRLAMPTERPDEGPDDLVIELAGAESGIFRVRLTPRSQQGHGGEVRRRQFLELSAKLASGLLAWQILDPERIQRLLRILEQPTRLDITIVDDVAKVAAAWHRSYWTVPAASLLPKVEGQLAIIEQLRAGATSDSHQARLAVTEAELSRLAGVINAQDRQDRTAAHRYYARALELATGSSHHAVAAYALGGMSFVDVYGGDPRAALRLATRAASHADRVQLPSLRSWVALISAHAHASLGHASETMTTIGQAKDLYAKDRRAGEPAWLGFLTEQFIASDEGACLVKLGRGRRATTILDQAMAGLPASALKLRSVILANRAAALRLTGDFDEACQSAGQALAIAAQIDYIRVTQRVREFHASLDPQSQVHPAARILDEQLALLATTPN